jgi:hypothetical protein
MASVVIRNLPAEVYLAIKLQAARHNRSAEAEIRAILESAVRPVGRLQLGTALAERSRALGLVAGDVEALG